MQKLPNWFLVNHNPSFHDCESQTAIEQTARIYGAMNDLIEETNEHTEMINKKIEEIPSIVTEDVNKHITKGEFDKQINKYIGNLEERVDNLVSNTPEGATSLDAELIDIRVGENGKTYNSSGDSVRSQFENLNHVLDDYILPLTLKPIKIYHEKEIGESGALWDNPKVTTLEFEVEPNTKYYINQPNGGRNYTRFYDSDMNQICKFTDLGVEYNTVFTTPENCKFIRWMIYVDEEHLNYKGLIIPEELYNKYGIHSGTLNNLHIPIADYAKSLTEILDMDKTTFENKYMIKNLLNPNKITTGQYCSFKYGEYTPSEKYYTTEPILITKGQTLQFLYPNGNLASCRMVASFDSNMKYVSGAENITSYTQTGNEYYIVASLLIGDQDNLCICDIGADTYMSYTDLPYINPKYILSSSETEHVSNVSGAKLKVSAMVDEIKELTAFPYHIKNGQDFSFTSKFSGSPNLSIGCGYQTYRGRWFTVTSSSISLIKYEDSMSIAKTVNHNLTLKDFVKINIHFANEKVIFTLATNGGTYSYNFDWDFEWCGSLFIKTTGTGNTLSNCTLTASSEKLNKDVWLFGDSYFGVNSERVIGHLKDLGYFDNLLINGLAGQNSTGAMKDLKRCLALGTPKTLVWCLGMNDDTTSYTTNVTSLINLCKEKGIKLVLTKIPSVPDKDKSEINTFIDNSGCIFINWFDAVVSSSGEWYTNTLSGDNVHPNELGAKLLAMQMLVDSTDILRYPDNPKGTSTTGSGTVDLTGYAKTTDIPTKTSQLTNDSGFLTEHQDLTGYAKTTDIPTKTSELTNDSGFLTSHQDISGKADKSSAETWTFTLSDGTTVSKKVVLAP